MNTDVALILILAIVMALATTFAGFMYGFIQHLG